MASAFAVLPSTWYGVGLANYIPTFQEYPSGRNDLNESCFYLGLEYTDILLFLVISHAMNLSLRQLKKDFKSQTTHTKKKHDSDLREVVQAVEEELRGSGSNVEYRQTTQRLVNDHRLAVGKETVQEFLKISDPEEAEL